MTIAAQIKEMTTDEKLETMELLWDELCQTPSSIPSPAWHGEVLAQREKKRKEGNEQYIDWEEAKKNIRAAVKQ